MNTVSSENDSLNGQKTIFLEAIDDAGNRSTAQIYIELINSKAPSDESLPEGVAIDGKTLRGSLKQDSSITHLLSAVSHNLGLTLAQCSVDSKTNEIGTIDGVLQELVLEGRIITTDAMYTQRKTCQTILDGDGDYSVLQVTDKTTIVKLSDRNIF